MLKINKCLNLTRKVPQITWVRNYEYEGKCPPRYECKQPVPHENEYSQERYRRRYTPAVFKCRPHRDPRIYRNIFLFLCLPAILCAWMNVYMEDERRMRPKFVPYPYLRIRHKQYPWDPVRTLFHNPDYNALPDGYETEFPPEYEYEPLDRYPCPVPRRSI